MNKNIFNQFCREKASSLLIELLKNRKGNYLRAISKNIDVTYSYIIILYPKFEDMGLIITETKGREKYIRLSEKGTEIALMLKNIYDFEN